MSSNKFWCCEVETLLKWILEEEKHGQIFGIQKDLFFIPRETDPLRMRRYGQLLETPLGVAAGPHTQLSQNLISAWLTGARYLELKTVQVLDEIEVTKPCIDMTDEGYNCEWSQELKLEQSFDEYLNAWIVLHILKDKFGWGSKVERGFIFNMSVGYNMEGILTPKMQRFLNRMQRLPGRIGRKDRTACGILSAGQGTEYSGWHIRQHYHFHHAWLSAGRGRKDRALLHRGAQTSHYHQTQSHSVGRRNVFATYSARKLGF